MCRNEPKKLYIHLSQKSLLNLEENTAHALSTLNPQPSTLNPQPSTLNHGSVLQGASLAPSTLNPSPRPRFAGGIAGTLNPKPLTTAPFCRGHRWHARRSLGSQLPVCRLREGGECAGFVVHG